MARYKVDMTLAGDQVNLTIKDGGKWALGPNANVRVGANTPVGLNVHIDDAQSGLMLVSDGFERSSLAYLVIYIETSHDTVALDIMLEARSGDSVVLINTPADSFVERKPGTYAPVLKLK